MRITRWVLGFMNRWVSRLRIIWEPMKRMCEMDVRAINRQRWDKQVELCNPWTIPCSPKVIAAARKGEWSVLLTEQRPVPRVWFPDDLRGVNILCLASGGGQQG